MDAGKLGELVSWVGGKSGDYVYSLAGGVIGGVPYVFGADEKGILFRGGALAPAIRRAKSHQVQDFFARIIAT
jgi:hypothetical protein